MRILTKPISILAVFASLLLVSCDSGGPEAEKVPQVDHTGEVTTVQVNDDGEAQIKSTITSQSTEYDLTLDLSVSGKNGEAVSSANVHYSQVNGKSVLYVEDPVQEYVSAFFVGTPEELKEHFEGGTSNSASSKRVNKAAGVGIAISAAVILVGATTASIRAAIEAREINQWFYSDFLKEGEDVSGDFVAFCKTPEGIAELMKSRALFGVSTADFILAFIPSTGAKRAVYEVAKEEIKDQARDKVRDFIVGRIIEHRVLSQLDDVAGKKVGVKVYFDGEEVNKLMDPLSVYDEPECSSGGDPEGGLVAHYPFDGNADDASGNGHDGTPEGDLQFVNGVKGQAISLDGEGDYVEVADSDEFDIATFTVSAWANLDAEPTSQVTNVLAHGEDPNTDVRNFALSIRDGRWVAESEYPNDENQFAFSSTGVEVDIWYHVVGTRDEDGNLSIFIDGILENTISAETALDPTIAQSLFIGTQYAPERGDVGNFFPGKIDDVRIYNRALSEQEVKDFYNE